MNTDSFLIFSSTVTPSIVWKNRKPSISPIRDESLERHVRKWSVHKCYWFLQSSRETASQPRNSVSWHSLKESLSLHRESNGSCRCYQTVRGNRLSSYMVGDTFSWCRLEESVLNSYSAFPGHDLEESGSSNLTTISHVPFSTRLNMLRSPGVKVYGLDRCTNSVLGVLDGS